MSKILAAGRKVNCTAVAFDDYLNVSIKSIEPDRQSSGNQLLLRTIFSSVAIKQWPLFLSCIDNENAVIAFVVSEWKKEKYRSLIEDKCVLCDGWPECFENQPRFRFSCRKF